VRRTVCKERSRGRGIFRRHSFIEAEEADVTECDVVKRRLGRFLDAELPPQESAVLRAHIEGCPVCQQEIRALQELSASLDTISVPSVPAGAVDVIMARVQQQGAGSRRIWGALDFWKTWPVAMRFAAVGTAVVACLIGLMLGSATSATINRSRSEMAWVGLASGTTITSAYGETQR
jgi:anti-sigma factor RsiW